MILNVHTDNLLAYSEKLKTLNRSAFPVAIRGALNDTAFMMKKETMPKHAKMAFIERQPNFFKANSRVEMATGFDINKMVSTMGMVSSGLHNQETNYAVRDLEQQEQGGTIHGRSFKPLPAARKSGTGNVRANSRISQLLKAGNVIDAKDSRPNRGGFTSSAMAQNSKMQQFIKASLHAGVGGYVLGGRILWKVTRITRHGDGSTSFKKQKLFSFSKGGVAKVKARGFIREAALEVQKEMEFFYKLQANKQIDKALKQFR